MKMDGSKEEELLILSVDGSSSEDEHIIKLKDSTKTNFKNVSTTSDDKLIETEEYKELRKILEDVGLEHRREVSTSVLQHKEKWIVTIKCQIDKDTKEEYKGCRDSKEEATKVATKGLISLLRNRYFPEQVTANEELVKYKEILEKFCISEKRGKPRYNTESKKGKYHSEVVVDMKSSGNYGCSFFKEEAEGMAAKSWLFLHDGNLKGKDQRSTSEIVADKIKLDDTQKQLEIACKRASPQKNKSGLAALDSMSKSDATKSTMSPKTSAQIVCKMLDEAKKNRGFIGKEDAPRLRRSPRKQVNKQLCKTIFGSSTDDEEVSPKKCAKIEPVKRKAPDIDNDPVDDDEIKLKKNTQINKQKPAKSRKIFATFMDENETEIKKESTKITFSPPKKKSSEKMDSSGSDHETIRFKSKKMFSKDKFAESNVDKEETVFKFSLEDKKEKQKEVAKKTKAPVKKEPAVKTPKPTSGSNVFDHEDDPIIVEINRKQKKEAEELAKRIKTRKNFRKSSSVAKMANFQFKQSLCDTAASFDNNKNTVKSEPKFTFKRPKNKINDDNKQKDISDFFSTKSKDKEEEYILNSREYAPDINELLRLPNRPDDGTKTKDEILDELDAEIAKKQLEHEREMAKMDLEIEEERLKRHERQLRLKQNAELRNRLEEELTEPKLREMFKKNKHYLKGIFNGTIESPRHQAFHKSVRTRQALYYTMITDPFTDNQLDWTLEEMSRLWMRNKQEQMDNNEYIWKVLLPECFIKFYMDMFEFNKEEAELRIGETPLHEKDSPRLHAGDDCEDYT